MLWGGTTKRKTPSPVLIQLPERPHSPATSSDADDMNPREIEEDLLEIITHRPSTSNGMSVSRKRPTLDDILANRSAPPWTFKAFNAYCTHNMCSENLNFIIDTRNYDQIWQGWRSDHPGDTIESSSDARSFELKSKWKRILREYITPNGLQEVNLAATVRDQLTKIPESETPPNPSTLNPAVRQIRILIEDSIFLSFLHDVQSTPVVEEHDRRTAPQIQATHRPKTVNAQTTLPSHREILKDPQSKPTTKKRSIPSSNAPTQSSRTTIFTTKDTHHTDKSTQDDDTSALNLNPSHSGSTTPPHPRPERRMSPWSRQDNTWKKISSRFGLKKRPSGQPLRSGEHAVEDDDEEGHS